MQCTLKSKKTYYLYILLCAGSSIYTGITNDLPKRLKKHAEGSGSKYVRSHLPFELVYKKKFKDKSTALKREAEIKSWAREEKIKKLHLEVV